MALAQLLGIPSVRNFLFDGKVMAEYRTVAEKHKLPKERSKEFLDLCNAILDDKLPLAEVPGIIAQAFGITEDEAKKISSDIVGYRILPVGEFFPGVSDQIIAWGGDPKNYPVQSFAKEKITAFLWATRVAEAVQLGFSDVLVKRLALLLDGRARGEKDAATLKIFFGRSLTIGGLALPKEKVDSLLDEVEREAPYIEIVSDDEYKRIQEDSEKATEVEEAAPDETVEAVAETPTAPSSTAIEIAPSKELAAEVPVHAGSGDERLRMAVDATMDAAKEIVLAKNIPLDKFRSIAEKNIRGVREPSKTRDILEQEYQLAGADLRVVLDALAMGKKQYDGDRPAATVGMPLAASSDAQESNALDQKFAEVTKTLPEESVTPIMPGSRVSAARETQGSSTKKVVALKPKLAKAELTVGSVAPMARDRKVTDVVPAERLMGPVDQLRNLSTIEFRRMSSDPGEASRKVEDLITALLATSYEERVKGIGAWRKSPLNQLYLSISEEALNSGMPIPDVCSKRRKEGKDCLSPTEIKAVVALNAKLRF